MALEFERWQRARYGYDGRPGGALRANPKNFAPNNSYGEVRYHVDLAFECRACGVREVWTAEQQRWWYEEAKGPIDSHAVRCRSCRRADA